MELRVEKLTVKFEDKTIIKDIDLSVSEGLHILLGPNGAGKSTLLKSIACIIKPSSGKIFIDGEELCNKPRKEIAKIVGYSWQNPLYGFFESTVEREVFFIIKNIGVTPRSDILDLLDIRGLMKRSPFELSGGEAKRVSLASILIANQPIVLLDEPFEELDWNGFRSLNKIIETFRKEGKILIISVNNPMLVENLKPDTFHIINSGKIVASGNWSELDDKLLEENGIVPRWFICRSCLS